MDTSPDGDTDLSLHKSKRRRDEDDMDEDDWDMDDEGVTKQLLSYDIYLKGNVSKSTSFFKTSGQTQRFRMFPSTERKRRVDEYGELVDVGIWIRKGKVLEAEAETEDVKDFRKRKQLEEEAKVHSSLDKCNQRYADVLYFRHNKSHPPSSSLQMLRCSWHANFFT